MRESIIVIIFAGIILLASSQWAEMLGKFFNAVVQSSSQMTKQEVSEDSLERFRKQVNLLRVKYDKAEEERQENASKNKELQENFDTILVQRKNNLGQLMQGVVHNEAQALAAQNNPAPRLDVQVVPAGLPPTPPPLPELKYLTQRLVSDTSIDLRHLMEQYDLLDEQRKMVVENMKSNLDAARERGRQAQSDYQTTSARLAEDARQNSRNVLEKFEQLEMARQSFINNRRSNETQVRELSSRIKEQLGALKSKVSAEGVNQFNSWQEQRVSMMRQQMELNEQIQQNARQLNGAMRSLESSTISLAESRADMIGNLLARARENSRQLQQQQDALMENLQSNLEESRNRNEQRVADMKERMARLSEANDSNQQRAKESMENMKYIQAQNKERMASQMQMIRDKINDLKR